MNRINTPNRAIDLFGAGKDGWKNRNIGLGVEPTEFNAEWFNGSQEELLNVIEGAGIAPSAAVRTQMFGAIRRLAGANIIIVTAAMSPFQLIADHAGVVLINATAGPVVLVLPAANAVANLPLKYSFRMTADTGNTGTVVKSAIGGNVDTIDGLASFVLSGRYASRSIYSDAASAWATLSTSVSSGLLLNVQEFYNTGTYTPTFGCKRVLVEVQGAGGAGGGAAACGSTQSSIGSGGSAGAYGRGLYDVTFSSGLVTIGAGGSGVLGQSGSPGGTSSFGALLSAPGGPGGTRAGPANAPFGITGALLSAVSVGGNILNAPGASGGISTSALGAIVSGAGASSFFGGGAPIPNVNETGINAIGRGAGGSGAYQIPNGGVLAGGFGGSGVVIILEFS